MYAVISFDDIDEMDFLPLNWIADITTLSDTQKVMRQRIVAQAYWLPSKLNVSKAKKHCLDPEVTWPVYSARILSIEMCNRVTVIFQLLKSKSLTPQIC